MLKLLIAGVLLGNVQLFVCDCYAQQHLQKDSAVSLSEKYVVNYFNKALGQQLPIYNGREYERMPYLVKSNPNYADLNDWETGSVKFNGYNYTNVLLKYDLFKDQLVSRLYNNFSEYVLPQDGVSEFEFAGHRFKFISADSTVNSPASGYYELFSNGRVEALARYIKTLQNLYSDNTITPYFTTASVAYYIKKGRDFTQVSSEGSLLNALKDHKKELQQFIKANKIKFRKQPAQAMALITTYYNQLNF